jgi:hypothetical protein
VRTEALGVLAGEVWAPPILQMPMQVLRLLGGEPVRDTPPEREHLRDGDGERWGRRKPAEFVLDVFTQVRRERMEHRDVCPD